MQASSQPRCRTDRRSVNARLCPCRTARRSVNALRGQLRGKLATSTDQRSILRASLQISPLLANTPCSGTRVSVFLRNQIGASCAPRSRICQQESKFPRLIRVFSTDLSFTKSARKCSMWRYATTASLSRLLVATVFLTGGLVCCSPAYAQGGGPPQNSPPPPRDNSELRARSAGPTFQIGPKININKVIIRGNQTVPSSKVMSFLRTRKGRSFDPEVVQSDVHRLSSSGLFHDVRTFKQTVPDGVVITFEVFERPTIRQIKFLGATGIKEKNTAEEEWTCGGRVAQHLQRGRSPPKGGRVLSRKRLQRCSRHHRQRQPTCRS